MAKELNMVAALSIPLFLQSLPIYCKQILMMHKLPYLNVRWIQWHYFLYYFFSACGVAHQAVESIEPDGEDVLILGCGPVGLLAVGIAKALGATKVYV